MYLIVGEDAKGVQLHVGRKPRTVPIAAGHNARHEGAMPEAILQRRLVRPVGALPVGARSFLDIP